MGIIMSVFSSYKKIFLLGFITVVLVTVPIFVFMAQQTQQTKSKASASTTLTFEPVSSTASPISTKVGDILTLNVMLDPGEGTATPNEISFAKLTIIYDSTKFTTESRCLTENKIQNALFTVLEGPLCEPGKASISLSIGADPANAVKTKTKIATLQLKASATTEGNNPSRVAFDITGNATQILSIAAGDKTNENVTNLLSTSTPALITINAASTQDSQGGANPTATPTPAPANTPPASTGPTPTPIVIVRTIGGGTPSAEITPEATIPTPTIAPEVIIQTPPTIILPPTGPGGSLLKVGIIGTILTIIGGALLLVL